MAPRRSTPDEQLALRLRVAELEARVRWLERRLTQVTPPPRSKARAKAVSLRPRCPGCLMEVPRGRRGKACRFCGFRFDAVPPIRPRRAR